MFRKTYQKLILFWYVYDAKLIVKEPEKMLIGYARVSTEGQNLDR